LNPRLWDKLTSQTDQGFLGVINVKVTDVIDLELGGQGQSAYTFHSAGS
jgi:hypothetical protein